MFEPYELPNSIRNGRLTGVRNTASGSADEPTMDGIALEAFITRLSVSFVTYVLRSPATQRADTVLMACMVVLYGKTRMVLRLSAFST